MDSMDGRTDGRTGGLLGVEALGQEERRGVQAQRQVPVDVREDQGMACNQSIKDTGG